MAIIVKIKKGKKRSPGLTPMQKKLLDAPRLSKKQVKEIEEAGKLTGKWKI